MYTINPQPMVGHRRAAGGVWLAPTRLAQALASGGAGDATGEVSQGFIVVETNYRVRPEHSMPGQGFQDCY